MNTIIPEFQATSACKSCKGECCKRMGCHFSPNDFEEISFDYLKSKIEEGYISIDWWENCDEPDQYYLRTRHVGAPIVDPSWGGRCVLLTDDGCPLPFEKRPLGARALQPSHGNCVGHYSKWQCKEDWTQYGNVLRALVVYYETVQLI